MECYLENSHQKCCIGGLGVLDRSVVIYFIFLVVGVGDELFQLGDVFPGFSEVERAKVQIKGLILQILHSASDT